MDAMISRLIDKLREWFHETVAIMFVPFTMQNRHLYLLAKDESGDQK